MRRLLVVLAMMLGAILTTAPSSQADGIVYWSIYYQAGNASGQYTSHAPDHYWHVSGRITDSTANTNCSYFRVRVRKVPQSTAYYEVYRKQVCGGASASFDVAGYAMLEDRAQISVCSNIAGFADLCSNKWLYLT